MKEQSTQKGMLKRTIKGARNRNLFHNLRSGLLCLNAVPHSSWHHCCHGNPWTWPVVLNTQRNPHQLLSSWSPDSNRSILFEYVRYTSLKKVKSVPSPFPVGAQSPIRRPPLWRHSGRFSLLPTFTSHFPRTRVASLWICRRARFSNKGSNLQSVFQSYSSSLQLSSVWPLSPSLC